MAPEVKTERHRRWTENYQYDITLKRSYKGRFVSIQSAEYQGRIYEQSDFEQAIANAEVLKEEL